MGIGSGKLRNDVWIGELTSGSQSPWRVDDTYFVDGGRTFNPELIRSQMRWREATPGRIAPPTWPSGPKYSLPLTYDEWIACQDSIKDRLDYTVTLPDPSVCDDPPRFCYEDINTPGCHEQGVWKNDNMWSPRRGHASAVVANDKIFVIGGQAREYARIEDSRLVGGLDDQRRVETMREHSTIREDLVLKNDVWSSSDGGVTWELVSPGCKDPQEDVLMQTEVWSRDHSNSSLPKYVGSIGSKCHLSTDCYGVAECKALGNTHEKVCVCPMFSPRMHHAIAVQHRYLDDGNSTFTEDVMYVVGGFAAVKQAFCANRSCGPSDGYRLAMGDVWMSADGVTWTQVKSAFSQGGSFRGRGGHTAMVIPSSNYTGGKDKDRLLIFGGETSDPRVSTVKYLNDVWQVDLPKYPCNSPAKGIECLPGLSDWNAVTSSAEWSERSGHVSVYEPPSSGNSFHHRIYLIGGRNATAALSDVWTWDLVEENAWQLDFSCRENNNFGNATALGSTSTFVSIDSPLADIKGIQLPHLDDAGDLFNRTNNTVLSIVSDSGVSIMAQEGVNTVRDLAFADLYSVLKLRGFDYPGRYAQEVANVCYLREITLAIVEKCSMKVSPSSLFHRGVVLGKDPLPEELPPILCGRGGESEPCLRGDWDGCTPIPGVSKVDVNGLGDVAVPPKLPNVLSVVDEIFCRQVPGGRYMGAAEFLDSKLVLLGGVGHDHGNKLTHLHRDVWTRDDAFPRAFITTKPSDRSPQSQFYFDSNEAGAHVFEYKLVTDDAIDVIPWTITTKNLGADVSWLDDKKGGPGKGWYTLYVRAVDPSGNRDNLFSTETNVYRWYYVPPIPWVAVSGCVIASLVLITGGYYEYRRRKKLATLQRFKLRRLRRKFKLRQSNQEVQKGLFHDSEGHANLHRSRLHGQYSNNPLSSRASSRSSRRRTNRHSRPYRSREDSSHRRERSRSRSRRTHRSHSRTRSTNSREKRQRSGSGEVRRRRRRERRSAEERAEAERRKRLIRDRDLLRRQM